MYIKDVHDSRSEQNGGSQHSTNLDNLPAANHNLHDQNACANGRSSGKTATSLTQSGSEISQYSFRKRKHELRHGRDTKRSYIKAQLESRNLKCSWPLERRLENNKDEKHAKQYKILETRKTTGSR